MTHQSLDSLANFGSRYKPTTSNSPYRSGITAADTLVLDTIDWATLGLVETNQLRTAYLHGRFSVGGATADITVVRGFKSSTGSFTVLDIQENATAATSYALDSKYFSDVIPVDTRGCSHIAALVKTISSGNLNIHLDVA